jgi:hypothetical protein
MCTFFTTLLNIYYVTERFLLLLKVYFHTKHIIYIIFMMLSLIINNFHRSFIIFAEQHIVLLSIYYFVERLLFY